MRLRRSLTALGVALLCFWFTAETANALSLHPTDWRSTIISIAPSTDGLSIEVLNGGEAIRITTEPGRTLDIPGYRNEPYLRVTADGEVEANLRSPTWWANRTGTGDGDIPESADPEATPEWSRVGSNGTVVWHDHRIHAMPGVTGATDWTVLVTVDGQPLVIRGQLTKLPSHAPVVELLTGIIIAIILVALGFRWEWRTAVVATIGASMLAVGVAIGAWIETPSGFTPPWIAIVAAGTALVCSLISFALRNRSRSARLIPLLGSIAALAWWLAVNLPAFTAASLPNALSDTVVRTALAIVTGCVGGTAIIVVITGGFSDTEPIPRIGQADDAVAGVVSE